MIDLSSARQGPRLFNVSGSDVRTPFGIEVMQVSPSSLTIHFERSASKVVPIVPALDGLPADGYVIDDVTVTPPTVEIVGPQSAIQNLKDATTEPVTVTDATGYVADTVTVGVVDPSLRLRAPLNAHVGIKVAPAPMEWAVAQIPVQIRNATGPIEVVPTRITVRVRGSRATMKSGADAFTASVDVAGLQRGQYQLPVQVVPPAGIGVTGVEPEQLVVRVR
jgi:YbbR domain-containing protein